MKKREKISEYEFDRSYYPLLKLLIETTENYIFPRSNSKAANATKIKCYMNKLIDGIDKLPLHLQLEIKDSPIYKQNIQLVDNIEDFIRQMSRLMSIFIQSTTDSQSAFLKDLTHTNFWIYNYRIRDELKNSVDDKFKEKIKKTFINEQSEHDFKFGVIYDDVKKLVYDSDKFEILPNYLTSILKKNIINAKNYKAKYELFIKNFKNNTNEYSKGNQVDYDNFLYKLKISSKIDIVNSGGHKRGVQFANIS